MRSVVFSVLLLAWASTSHAQPRTLGADEINRAEFSEAEANASKGPTALIVKAQTLLSRRNISPGEIDGVDGENFRKAIAQFRRQEKLEDGEKLDARVWSALTKNGNEPIIVEETITKDVADYDFAKEIPKDYSQQAAMKRLSYVRPEEMLAERYHMSERLLKQLNPKADFNKAGARIFVVSAQRTKLREPVARLEANKRTGMLIAYGKGEEILASYPATIGSDENPSPDGELKIVRIAANPTYSYDPEKNFQQGNNRNKLTLPPGPNNLVGSVWIALSKPTFGIHGTPEPSKVSKNESHGCVRLTNWDAEHLSKLVKPGLSIRFTD